MSVATAPVRPTVPTRHLFTVDDYYRMGEAGLFQPGTRVELIDGEIVDMNPIGDRHNACVNRLNRLLDRQAGDDTIVQIQGPVRLSDTSEPEPDLALLAYREDFYASGKARPDDILLLVEVADTTLAFDRKVKGQLYAVTGIPEYWIVDLTANVMRVFSDPAGGKYHTPTVARPGDVLVPRLLPQVSVAISEVLGVA